MVYGASFRLVRNHAISEDISQEAFLRAHEQIGALRQPAAFKGWVRKIAVRLAVDHLRRRTMDPLIDDEVDPGPGPEAAYEALDAIQRFRAKLDSLPSTQRAVVVLRDVEGFSIRETAEQLEISEGAVKMRLKRGREALREVLEQGRERI